jgi:DNA-binding XRE family transcriptional regulator
MDTDIYSISHFTLTCKKPVKANHMVTPKTVGERLRKRREDLGLTLLHAATLLGVSEQAAWLCEHRKHEPKGRSVTALAT